MHEYSRSRVLSVRSSRQPLKRRRPYLRCQLPNGAVRTRTVQRQNWCPPDQVYESEALRTNCRRSTELLRSATARPILLHRVHQEPEAAAQILDGRRRLRGRLTRQRRRDPRTEPPHARCVAREKATRCTTSSSTAATTTSIGEARWPTA